MSKREKLMKELSTDLKDIPTVKVDKDGRISNWNQLSDMAKEDALEDGIYDNVDFSKSKDRTPALKLYKSKHNNLPPYWL